MKHIRIVIFFSLLILRSEAQYVSIPDTILVNWLNQNGYTACMNGNLMDTTCTTITDARSVFMSDLYLHDLTGIQYFDNLDTLICINNYDSLTNLPPLPATITYLNLWVNHINRLPPLPPNLKYLNCQNNWVLDSLPPLPNTLTDFNCSWNNLTYLPSLPSSLINLDCSYTSINSLPSLPNSLVNLSCDYDFQLTALPVLNNGLQSIICHHSPLLTLPVLPLSLLHLECNDTRLTTLPSLPDNLEYLNISWDTISVLPSLPVSLKYLYCDDTHINTIPTLPIGLKELWCSKTYITALPALNPSLRMLGCGVNSITSLPMLPDSIEFIDAIATNISSLPALPQSLKSLRVYGTPITLIPELPDSMDYFCCSFTTVSCLPRIKIINTLDIRNTNITCLPNHGIIHTSYLDISSFPICDSLTPNPCPYCNARFSIFTDTSNSGIYYGYNESIANGFTSCLWQFGDGDTSTELYPSHSYSQPDHYYVCLTVNGASCTDTYCDSSFYVFKTEGGLMSQLNIVAPTGISPIRNSNFVIRISPNPFSSSISVSLQKENLQQADFTITNIIGQPVYTKHESNLSSTYTKTLDLGYLPAGVYFLQVIADGERSVRQLVKQ